MDKNDLFRYTISSLQMEYNAHRQELRDLINSMDSNFKTGVAMLTIAITGAIASHELYILYIIPTIIYMIASLHLLKVASANVQGAYCQVIQNRIKKLMHDESTIDKSTIDESTIDESTIINTNILLDFEGGEVSKYISRPMCTVQIGFYLFFLVIFGIFIWISILSFLWKNWTIIIHVLELFFIIVYSISVIKDKARGNIIEHYSK